MTKAIQLLLLGIILAPFAKAQNEFHFSGKLSNASNKAVYIAAPGFEKTIHLDENGFFDETFEIPHNGAYNIYYQDFYFKQGESLNIKGNLDSMYHFCFDGTLAPENKHWQEKVNKIIAFKADTVLYEKPIALFKLQLAALHSSFTPLKSAIQNESFLSLEEKINYYIIQREEYSYWLHQKAPNKKEFKLFIDQFNKLNIFDEVLFLFSSSYRAFPRRKLFIPDETFKPSKKLNNIQYREYVINYKLAQRDKVKSNIIKDDLGLAILNDIKVNEISSFDIAVYDSILSSTTSEVVKNKILHDISVRSQLKPGSYSPNFEYENFLGGTTKLSDFRGKLVYIDIWATWCSPCIEQYPYFKNLEKQYNNKDIVFVTISTDHLKDYDKWKNMVKSQDESAYSLFAKNSFGPDFISFYRVRYIPRFILIGKKGEIISPDAPMPSDKEAIEKLIDEHLQK